LKPNTLVLECPHPPSFLILEAMQVLLRATTLFFCYCRVVAFGSQDLGFKTWLSILRSSTGARSCVFPCVQWSHTSLFSTSSGHRQTDATSDFIYKISCSLQISRHSVKPTQL
jgi:hypothetical protein